jgi:metal-responsive CopG/Arc/MetJ family transcriptional regulator
MPSEKPRIIFVLEEVLLKRIDDFRFDSRINTRSEAIRRLIEESLKRHELKKQPRKKE